MLTPAQLMHIATNVDDKYVATQKMSIYVDDIYIYIHAHTLLVAQKQTAFK